MQIKILGYCAKIYKIIPMILALALLSFSPSLADDNNNGEALLGRCKSVEKIGKQGVVLDRSETSNLMYCLGYINGFMGMYYNTVMLDNFKTTPYCLPQGVNWKPLARIVVDYSESHPELLHQPAEALTAMALSEKFPCNNKTP